MRDETLQEQALPATLHGSDTSEIVTELSEEGRLKLQILETLMEPCNKGTYGQRLKEAAAKLNRSVRSVQRLVKDWEEKGLSAITKTKRPGKGQHRINEEWQEFILDTYKRGNKGGKRMTRKQVFIRVQARAEELGVKSLSHMTVYRVLKPLIERQEKAKSIRSPGWRGSRLVLKTRDGKELQVEYSNHVWQADHTEVDVLLVDQYGEILGRPWLTTIVDCYSRCVMGINLGFDPPSSQVVALTLRHAILPKHYGPEYCLGSEWGTYGTPEYFYTDGGKDFRSNHLQQIGVQLGFTCYLREHPSEGGIVERPFGTFNTDFFSTLPGYTGSNVQKRPEEAEKEACLTLRELEQRLVRYIVDKYNQRLDSRMGDQTRFERWEFGLRITPNLISERDLDICLMKQARRSIQRGGYLQFENLMYRGDCLAGYAGDSVVLRYDPRDITTVLVYRRESDREVFLAKAHAADLEAEQLSLEEAKANSRRIRSKGKEISNRTMLDEVRDRDIFVEQKQGKKERKKAEQAALRNSVNQPETIEKEMEEVVSVQAESKPEMPEVFDYEQLREDYGW